MKKLSFILWFILVSFVTNAQTKYYYFRGERIPLTVNKDYVNVIIMQDGVEGMLSATQLLEELGLEQKEGHSADGLIRLRISSASAPQISEYSMIIELLRQNQHIRYVFPFFERGEGIEPIGTSNYFYIQLRSIEDVVLLERVAGRKSVQIIRQIPYMPLWYILSIRGSSFNNSIEATNYFFRTGLFQEVDPAFMFNFRPSCVNDPMFGQLWGLKNTTNTFGSYSVDINICNAWAITRGAGINIAIVDQGIDPYHNDLYGNFHPLSFDAETGKSPSVFVGLNHGTHVAGIIGAIKNNGLQVVGVAPEARIIRVSHTMSSFNPNISAELASGISWAWYEAGADIINNSWGDQGGQLFNLLHSAVLETAIIEALANGRNGKGAIVVFSAGNRGVIDYPANFHDEILVVGAVDQFGQRSIFNSQQSSGVGFQLDVVAPGSGILSTNNSNDTITMSGTSMAAPHVAGVAALMLSVNPSLTGQQVRNSIKRTAQRIRPDLYTYSYHPNRPNGTWNNQVGHGLVDAYAAVREVFLPAIVGPDTIFTAGTFALNCPNLVADWFLEPSSCFEFVSDCHDVHSVEVRAIRFYSQTLYLLAVVNGETIIRAVHVSTPTITGPAAVCFSTLATFSIENFPNGATVQWSHGHSLHIAGDGNAYRVWFSNYRIHEEGDRLTNILIGPTSWIGAEISFNGHTTTLHHDLTVGRINLGTIQIPRAPTRSGCQTQFWHRFTSTHNGWGTVDWAVSPATASIRHVSDTQADIKFHKAGIYTITASIANACGVTSRDVTIYISAQTFEPWPPIACLFCGGIGCFFCSPFTWAFSPNPVSDILNIDLTHGEIDGLNIEPTLELFFDIRLFNSQGMIVRQQRTQARTIQFDVSNLPEGTYYLHIEHNGEVEMHQIIVQRN